MSTTELFFDRLKKMQKTARRIKPAAKNIINKIVLPNRVKDGDAPFSKKEDNCLF
jgi:hypothetical protein